MATTETSKTTFETPNDHEVVMKRTFDAPRALVWKAWTSPDHLPFWMLGPEGWSMPVCEIDLRPGGRWRFVWRRTDGSEMEMHGEYREIDPPELLVSTENWGGGWPETVNTVRLSDEVERTTVALTISYPSKEARDAAMQTGMKDGADASFDRLAQVLAGLQAGRTPADAAGPAAG